jgi:GNAT superfamily N-acetyltransferase
MKILDTLPPGALSRVIGMQAEWYGRNWGFGLPFEALVAAEVGDYGLALPHPDCRSWVALEHNQVVGTITIDGRAAPSARLRWFIVEERARGGLGRQLLDRALTFCREREFSQVWLTTFAGLDVARGLYEQAGFRLEHEEPDTTWGVRVAEQRFRLDLSPAARFARGDESLSDHAPQRAKETVGQLA